MITAQHSTAQHSTVLLCRKILFIVAVSMLAISSKISFAEEQVERAGDIIQILIPAIGYGATLYLDDSEGKTQFYKSAGSTFLITHGLKRLINAERPNGGRHSFPSGHTSAAFHGASFIHKRYGIKYAIPAYIGASFVGYSRVVSDNHYVQDVLAGAALGIASSYFFVEPYQGMRIEPLISEDTLGISIRGNF